MKTLITAFGALMALLMGWDLYAAGHPALHFGGWVAAGVLMAGHVLRTVVDQHQLLCLDTLAKDDIGPRQTRVIRAELVAMSDRFVCHPASQGIAQVEDAGELMRMAADEIGRLTVLVYLPLHDQVQPAAPVARETVR
jgi:hypothetical protein